MNRARHTQPHAPYPALRATFPPVGARKGLLFNLFSSPALPFRGTGRRDSITNDGGGAFGFSFPCPHRGKGGRRPDRGQGREEVASPLETDYLS